MTQVIRRRAGKKAPLATDARQAAFKALISVQSGGFPEDALNRLSNGLDPRDQALASAIVYGVLTHQRRLDWVLDRFLKKGVRSLEPEVLIILRLSLFQLTDLSRVPASATVNEGVNLARAHAPGAAPGLVNGVLRAILRAPRPLLPTKPAVLHSCPDWLASRLGAQLGAAEAEELMAAMNQNPPLTLLVNPARATREELAARLEEQGLPSEPTPLSPHGLRVLTPSGPVTRLPGYDEGLFMVQDEASQLVSMMATALHGPTLLDAAAGKGGKCLAAGLVSGQKIHLTALDPEEKRLGLLPAEARRLGLETPSLIQAALENASLPETGFASVLLDAPCSSLGVIRRRPDVKWRKNEASIASLAGLQARLLAAAARATMPGGRLLYSVCTFTPEETTNQAEAFLAAHPDFTPLSAAELLPKAASPLVEKGFLRAWPHRHATDGFFAAAFTRRA